ncbi:hypothetical protein AVEN_57750-1 [Araneus ventricosus]|uniref:Uncharacterized protein n=1 Tax=Araneus ventricosus TaxID=182803 RepID=A0A4Y2M8K1_ARAVE|nr:hypothetical protein AVEN_57750-1 [Araneus ventricosus]
MGTWLLFKANVRNFLRNTRTKNYIRFSKNSETPTKYLSEHEHQSVFSIMSSGYVFKESWCLNDVQEERFYQYFKVLEERYQNIGYKHLLAVYCWWYGCCNGIRHGAAFCLLLEHPVRLTTA